MKRLLSDHFLAYFLNVAAEAEASDRGMFESISGTVDESLRAGILRHAEDERRHASLLRDCIASLGGSPGPVPEELQLFNRLLDAASIDDPSSQLLEFFLLLMVAEERAAKQYGMIADALEETRPEVAEALRRIADDEAAHIVHCHKLAAMFAEDQVVFDSTLAGMREIEAAVFSAFAAAVLSGYGGEG